MQTFMLTTLALLVLCGMANAANVKAEVIASKTDAAIDAAMEQAEIIASKTDAAIDAAMEKVKKAQSAVAEKVAASEAMAVKSHAGRADSTLLAHIHKAIEANNRPQVAETTEKIVQEHVKLLQKTVISKRVSSKSVSNKRVSSKRVKRMRGKKGIDDADEGSADTDSETDDKATDAEEQDDVAKNVSAMHNSTPPKVQTPAKTQVKEATTAQFQLRSAAKVKAQVQVNSATDSEDADEDIDEDDSDANEGPTVAQQKAEAAADLKAVRFKKMKAQTELAHFKNGKAFKVKLEAEKKVVSNETASPGLAQFLVEMRKEMRTYASPGYEAHLEQKASDLETQEKALADKIAALEKKEKGIDEDADKKEAAEKEDKSSDANIRIDHLENALRMKSASAGHVFAIAFMCTIILISVMFSMAAPTQQNETVRNYTWFIFNQVILIFLAVMYFQAFEELLDFIDFGGSEAIVSVSHALAVLFLALLTAVILRKGGYKTGLAIVCGAGAHVASFTSIDAGATVQNNIWMSANYSWYSCVTGMAVYCAAIALLGFVIFHIKRMIGVDKDDDFMDKTNDLENDFGAMGLAVIWTMFVRYMLTGHHPVDDDTDFDHTQTQRNKMLVYAVLTVPVAAVVVFICTKVSSTSHPMFLSRVCTFFSAVAGMNVAWGWLYWGEWQFFETMYKGNPIFGRVLWAMIASIVGVLGIWVLSVVPRKAKGVSDEEKRAFKMVGRAIQVGLTAFGLVIAWSWELCFDSAVDDLTEGTQHRHLWKMGACVVMFLVVIPTYAQHIFPITQEAAEAIGA